MSDPSPVFGDGLSHLPMEVPPIFGQRSVDHFHLNNNGMAVVVAMSIGVLALEGLLDRPLFKEAKNSKAFTPSNAIIKDKINCGASILLSKTNSLVVFSDGKGYGRLPQPMQWKKKKCIEWLKNQDHSTVNDAGCSWITAKTAEYKRQLQAVAESNADDNNDNWPTGHWKRKEFKSVIHLVQSFECIMLNKLRDNYHQHNLTKTRQQLDAGRNFTSFWDLVVDFDNNNSFKVRRAALPSTWGPWFVEMQDCDFGLARQMTASDAKNQFWEWTNELNAVIKKWKLSGNGKGAFSIDDCEDLSADPTNIPTGGGDKLNFLGSCHPILMYIWNCLEVNGMLEGAGPELDDLFQGNGSCTPSTTQQGKSKVSKESDSLKDATKRMIDALQENSQLQIDKYEQLSLKCQNDASKGRQLLHKLAVFDAEIRRLCQLIDEMESKVIFLEDTRIVTCATTHINKKKEELRSQPN